MTAFFIAFFLQSIWLQTSSTNAPWVHFFTAGKKNAAIPPFFNMSRQRFIAKGNVDDMAAVTRGLVRFISLLPAGGVGKITVPFIRNFKDSVLERHSARGSGPPFVHGLVGWVAWKVAQLET